jgi:hypothetical protein
MGINRKTVAKYREKTSVEASDVLSGKEEEMLFRAKAKELKEELSKSDKKKLDLLKMYSDKDVKEMLAYIAQNSKREIDEVL